MLASNKSVSHSRQPWDLFLERDQKGGQGQRSGKWIVDG